MKLINNCDFSCIPLKAQCSSHGMKYKFPSSPIASIHIWKSHSVKKKIKNLHWHIRQDKISLPSFQVLSIFWIRNGDQIKIFPTVSSFCVGRISTSSVFWHKCQYCAYLMFSLHKINLAKWQGQTISLITTNSLQPLHIKNILKLNLSSMTEHVLFIF